MIKNLTVEQWLEVLDGYTTEGLGKASRVYRSFGIRPVGEKNLRKRIKNKYVLVQNKGISALERKTGSGMGKRTRKNKKDNSDIDAIIDELTEKQKREIIQDWIIQKRREKDKEKLEAIASLKVSTKAKILNMDRTSFYKKKRVRKYKYDYLKDKVLLIFNSSKGIYGSRKISKLLELEGIFICARTLRRCMLRWGIATLTRAKKRKPESKNTNVKYIDLVHRNYNPDIDNIIATDVSYIPANVAQNNVYFSIMISHKTKLIEAWELSENNNTQLVIDTFKKLAPGRKNFILHSDHGSQYSTAAVQEIVNKLGSVTSMSRIGNSLDNREAEYFFSCIKSEYLNHMNTLMMNFDEIYHHVSWYIEWYNNKRIQKVLKWKTPALAGALAF